MNLFEKVLEMRDKFCGLFQHHKKIQALENFSQAPSYRYKNHVELIKASMREGFLDEEEARFLDHMLKKSEIYYLDWAHKTRWVKQQIAKMIAEKKRAQSSAQPLLFNFDKVAKTPINIPVEILGNVTKMNRRGMR